MDFIFPKLPSLSLWDLACLLTGQNATDHKPTNETRHKLAELVLAIYKKELWVEWGPGADFDFMSGFVPRAASARVDTDWHKLDQVTVRRDDWSRYTELKAAPSGQPNKAPLGRPDPPAPRFKPSGGDALTPMIWEICYDLRDAHEEIKPQKVMAELRQRAEMNVYPLLCVVTGGVKYELEVGGDEKELTNERLRARIKEWRKAVTGG